MKWHAQHHFSCDWHSLISAGIQAIDPSIKQERTNFLLHLRNKGSNFKFILLLSYPNAQQERIFAYFITKGESCLRLEFLTIGTGQKKNYLEKQNSFRNTCFSTASKSLRNNNLLINENTCMHFSKNRDILHQENTVKYWDTCFTRLNYVSSGMHVHPSILKIQI